MVGSARRAAAGVSGRRRRRTWRRRRRTVRRGGGGGDEWRRSMWPTRGIHARSCRPLSPSSSPACRLVDLHVLMWLRQRTERRAYWMSLPTIRSIALCSSAPARRPKTAAGTRIWPKPMLDRRGNMGIPAGGYHHVYSIKQSTYVLFPFVLCILYLVGDVCHVCFVLICIVLACMLCL